MPTYSFRCQTCARVDEVVRPIREHIANPRPYYCCRAEMDRYFPPVGGRAIDNALAGDRSYAGLRATDGTDISTRSKHREYMRRHGLTTADDFKDTWAKAQAKRDEFRTTGKGGAITRNDIAETIARMKGT